MSFVVYVNDTKYSLRGEDTDKTVLEFLREQGHTGTKLGCGEGGCGACTVMLTQVGFDGKVTSRSCNACMTPVCSAAGARVTTVEGIGSVRTGLHPVQAAIAHGHGSQCGFCTPGIVMSMYALLKTNSKPTEKTVEEAFDGNLCRCTGYRPILDSFKKEAVRTCDVPADTLTDLPVELRSPVELHLEGPGVSWYRPTSLPDLLRLKSERPEAKVVGGNTEMHIEMRFGMNDYTCFLSPSLVPELNCVEMREDGLRVGSAVTLTRLEEALKEAINVRPEHETSFCTAGLEMLRWFAGTQVRNMATIGGNIATASPISDLNPLWLAQGATLLLEGSGGARVVPFTDWIIGYRKTCLATKEVIVAVHVPWNAEGEVTMAFKQARRRGDDIAIVNAALRTRFSNKAIVTDAHFAFGGMSWKTVSAPETAAIVVGQKWSQETVELALASLKVELALADDAPGGQVAYRRVLPGSFFRKFSLAVTQYLVLKKWLSSEVDPRDVSGPSLIERDVSSGKQAYEIVDSRFIHQPVMHVSAEKQASGEALYTDDIPTPRGTLHAYPVLSTKAHAKISACDASEALAIPGVVDFVSHEDVPGDNSIGAIVHDEEVFATDEVHCCGQVIGLVLAKDQLTAKRAAHKVKVTYEDLPSIITLREAMDASSYFEGSRQVARGEDIDAALAASPHVLSGTMDVGAQEQFYLETNVTLAIPAEGGRGMQLYCSTQAPSKTHQLVATTLGVPSALVQTTVKRMGGAFGGKETRSVFASCAVAVAAAKARAPVKWALDRDTDMQTTGMRHPFHAKYTVGYTDDGKVLALKLELFSNGGCSADLSFPVLERAVLHVDNAYNFPSLFVLGRVCRTNTTTATAFRGFGGPQGMVICENVMDVVSEALNMRPELVRKTNLYEEGDETHYGQTLTDCNIPRVWEELEISSSFAERRKTVDAYNAAHKWKKRGIAMIPVKFGMSFNALFMNQGGALVHVLVDGSVLVAHGGTEMGQGLHTKMLQVTAHALNVDMALVHIDNTSTATVANTLPTAASVSSDIYGRAIMDACDQIKQRLAPYYSKLGDDATLAQVAAAAYFDRVPLSAHGFFATPDIGYVFDGKQGVGFPFNYFSFGASCCEVEVDVLTGDHMVIRNDVMMDVGKSLNPALDIGQIEGAWVQGYGLFTLEEIRRRTDGSLESAGPGTYKIPGFEDIPMDFRVSLLSDAANNRPTVHSSKGIGEPPLFLGSSAFFAIKDALRAARKETNSTQDLKDMSSPMTSEKIRLAC